MQKTLGGDRLGSGNKMQVYLHDYGYSNHNLGRAWRSTMAPGTLVPFLVEPALNGDQFDIDLHALVRTHPTIAPMFGSFKLQMDIFVCPMRLYNKQLHNNKLNIGMKMDTVLFPLLEITAGTSNEWAINPNLHQINPSSIFSYLGIRGIGSRVPYSPGGTHTRQFDAQPFLAYWDIFKNYYANKQEEDAYVISSTLLNSNTYLNWIQVVEQNILYTKQTNGFWTDLSGVFQGTNRAITFTGTAMNYSNITVQIEQAGTSNILFFGTVRELIDKYAGSVNVVESNPENFTIMIDDINVTFGFPIRIKAKGSALTPSSMGTPILQSFPLSNIDEMREDILSVPSEVPFIINAQSRLPYSSALSYLDTVSYFPKCVSELSGLAVKTYQSDRFNTWLSSEWIDGANGISQLSSVDTSDGSFTMDALNLAQKVYNMLNRIAVSGGSFVNWQEAVYGETIHPMPETPWFAGGSSQEITFSEVTSTSETSDDMPLGTLAGKGFSSGGSNRIHVKILEPSYIIGIVSITPRIDYSQGNRWFTRLRTMDDLHKPQLDGIGFQELITEEMAAWDADIDGSGNIVYRSAGKQPSWIHYMTAVNETYGNFAIPDMEMYMTLNRNYSQFNKSIRDLTTYIDPSKFNSNFARTDLGAQNFWVQIGMDITARRKMSAKQIPNF